MSLTKTEHGFRLASGREVQPNDGIYGLRADLQITDGYDSIGPCLTWDILEDAPPAPLTAAERAEIAAMMIDRWTRWITAGSPDDDVWT